MIFYTFFYRILGRNCIAHPTLSLNRYRALAIVCRAGWSGRCSRVRDILQHDVLWDACHRLLEAGRARASWNYYTAEMFHTSKIEGFCSDTNIVTRFCSSWGRVLKLLLSQGAEESYLKASLSGDLARRISTNVTDRLSTAVQNNRMYVVWSRTVI